MGSVVVVLHIIFAVSLIGLVLIQKSEGGGLGIGGSGGMGSFMNARGTANFLTRLTTAVATCFFITSMLLAVMQSGTNKHDSLFSEEVAEKEAGIEISADTIPNLDKINVPISGGKND
ncbi:MAG: preprotein translocase subunit SecG [Alphaproteobacteria bacterium]